MKSFQHAIRGLISAVRTEPNFRFHLVAAVITVAAGLLLHVSASEWLLLIFCIAMVTGFELFNTAIEELCNHVTPTEHPAIKQIKDLAAAAVLVVSIASLIVGLIIFLPKLLQLFSV